jgi:hypothetical protein
MIYATREGTKLALVLRFHDFVPGVKHDKDNTFWTFNFDMGSTREVVAQVMANAVQHAMNEKIREIRRLAYEAGYKDGRGKQTRCTKFDTGWGTGDDGCWA